MNRTKGGGDAVATAREPWLGGFVRRTGTGKPVYVIEKRIGGAYFKVSTRCHTKSAAVKELARFEADPLGYRPGVVVAGDAVKLTAELITEYRDHLTAAGNTVEWAQENGRLLADWQEQLGHLDLRRVGATEHVKPALKQWSTSLPARVTVLKGLFSWLVKEKGLVKHAENPMPAVRIPKRGAAKEQGRARDVPFNRVQLVYAHLRADLRDVLLLLSGTGWHVSEVRRFATGGEIRQDPTGKHLAVLVTFHKRREYAVSGLTHPEHVEAARRIREAGHIVSRNVLAANMRKACDAAGLPVDAAERVFFGAMRHSVATWAIEAGDEMLNVARAFNHQGEEMLRRHYVRHAVPRATVKTRVLG
jgi:integrase